ncbi:MAG: hypothetical protein IJN00_07895 [Clostridia bacterium]|nr:hypothetical protein [Clostridia bacterium]
MICVILFPGFSITGFRGTNKIPYEQSEKAYHYNLEVERYCQEQGITIGQYEKQCFWADRDWGNYPEPERHNPDRCIEPEREAPTHSRMEHER